MEMKVLFLDIDGVIALSDIDDIDENGMTMTNRHGIDISFSSFNLKCIEALNEIIEKTECEIIISSDWRNHLTLEQFDLLFKIRGINKSPLNVTEFVQPKSVWHLEETRAKEINMFLNTNREILKWVVIDDMDLSNWFPNNFVQTPNLALGVSEEKRKNKIIEILNNE